MSDNNDLFELLLDFNHPDKVVREATLQVLVKLGSDAVPSLVEEFDQIGGSARLYVIRVLGLIGDVRAVPLLLELVVSDNIEEYIFVSSLAARSLRQIGDETAVAGLVELLSHERSGPSRMAATVLGNIGSAQAVPGLIDALGNRDPQTRALSARALEQIGTPRAIAAVAVWREQED
ncbi:MAG: HEAT repeat domain-containing protein [Anaerolineae bacterium]|nr:HEAT repeat domain-containing protein [Anaerolineae bacterium]